MSKVCFDNSTLNTFFLFLLILSIGLFNLFNKLTFKNKNSLTEENNNNYKYVNNIKENDYKQQLTSCKLNNIKETDYEQQLTSCKLNNNKNLEDIQSYKDKLENYKETLSECKIEKKIHTNEAINYKRLSDPLLPPERTYPYMETRMVPINIPTRGLPEQFQQMGVLLKNDDSGETFALFGRREYPGSRNYEYYVTSSSKYNALKIPLDNKKELYNDNELTIPGYSGSFKVKLYEFDSPRYIPYVY
jgi:hypothetical protein